MNCAEEVVSIFFSIAHFAAGCGIMVQTIERSGVKNYIALGYGQTQGVPHSSKAAAAVSAPADAPAWFRAGVEAALLAPTAMNQQKFFLECDGGTVRAKAGSGFYTKVDLGIVKYHFELGAGKENFTWR